MMQKPYAKKHPNCRKPKTRRKPQREEDGKPWPVSEELWKATPDFNASGERVKGKIVTHQPRIPYSERLLSKCNRLFSQNWVKEDFKRKED